MKIYGKCIKKNYDKLQCYFFNLGGGQVTISLNLDRQEALSGLTG